MRVLSVQQPARVIEQLEAAGVGHEATVKADLVALFMREQPYFCDFQLQNISWVAVGDGGALPIDVDFSGRIHLPSEEGFFTLKNALIHVNGAIQIRATEDTHITPLELPITY